MTVILHGTREAWLRARMDGVGGSDAPIIMGLTTWESPYGLALAKRGLVPDKDVSEPMEMGLLVEPVLRQHFSAKSGWTVGFEQFTIFRSDEIPWMFCTPDGVITATQHPGPGALELKCVGWLTQESLENPASPERVLWDTQLQHILAVTGWKWGAIGVSIANQRFRWYVVQRDDKRIAEIIKAERDFWEPLQNDIFPPVDGSDATEKALRRRYGIDNKQSVMLGAEAGILFEEMERAEKEIDQWTPTFKRARNGLIAAIGPNTNAILPSGVRLSFRRTYSGARVLKKEWIKR